MFRADCGGVDFGLCGSRTSIGIGAAASVTPQTEIALIDCFDKPFNMPAKKVGVLSVIVTRMKAVGAIDVGGAVTPGTVPGKSTFTLLPKAVLPLATVLAKPFRAA